MIGQTKPNSPLPGFRDIVFDSQSVFRSLMAAVAYPGRVFSVDRDFSAPEPLNAASAGLFLTLADPETALWLDPAATASDDAQSWLRFHCGSPIVDSQSARFAIVSNARLMPRLGEFFSGDIQYPDRSTTVVVQVLSLSEGPLTNWSGPGIQSTMCPAISGLPDWFWKDWELNNLGYPLGVDVFLTCGADVIGLPRTVRVES